MGGRATALITTARPYRCTQQVAHRDRDLDRPLSWAGPVTRPGGATLTVIGTDTGADVLIMSDRPRGAR